MRASKHKTLLTNFSLHFRTWRGKDSGSKEDGIKVGENEEPEKSEKDAHLAPSPCLSPCSLYHGYHGPLQACQGDKPQWQLRDEHGPPPGVITQISNCWLPLKERPSGRPSQGRAADPGVRACQEHSDLSLILFQGRLVLSSCQAEWGEEVQGWDGIPST